MGYELLLLKNYGELQSPDYCKSDLLGLHEFSFRALLYCIALADLTDGLEIFEFEMCYHMS